MATAIFEAMTALFPLVNQYVMQPGDSDAYLALSGDLAFAY
jgi:hypothetical protein